MKLKKVTCIDPITRIQLALRESTQQQIDLYRELYTQTHGDPITVSQLIEELLRDAFASDKDFLKFQAARAAQTEPKPSHGVLRNQDSTQAIAPYAQS